MKKCLFALVLVLVGLFAYGCGGDNNTDKLKVGLVVSAAGANDNGYNQFAIEGLREAETEYGIEINVVETADDVPGSLTLLAEEGYDLVFSLEYNFDALITNDGSGKSIAEKYPETTFVVFNEFANTNAETKEKIHDNVIEVLFAVNEGSFLAGALSVLVNENNAVLFTDDDYHFTAPSVSRAVGFVGGTQSNGISVFGFGFAQGVNYVAHELGVTYRLYENYSAGFGASDANYNLIKSYYDGGANVVFAAAGGVSTNLKNAAKATGKLAIDVDANQDASVPGSVLTSVLKNTNVAVKDIVEKAVNGTLEGGVEIFYDLNSGATGVTDLSVIEGYIADTEAAQTKWNEIKTKLAEIAADISNGEIDVVDAQSGETLNYSTLTNVVKAN